MKFDKAPLSFEQQINQLTERGLSITNPKNAQTTLSHINYYRLSAYWYPFEKNHDTHEFHEGVNFEQVISAYVFDRSLRLLLLDAIERIEVSVKTQWAHHMSIKYGAHAYTINNKSLRKNENHFAKNLAQITEQVENSEESFIAHFRSKYEEQLPPIWAVVEVLSLGLISRLYSNLRSYQVRQAIAKTYQLDESYLEGFLEHLTYIRNICAHHGHLWNKHLVKKMPTPRGKPAGLKDNMKIDENYHSEHKVYNTLVMIQHLMTVISPASRWASRLHDLIEKHEVNTSYMGFPDDWKNRPLWQVALNPKQEDKHHANT